MRNVREKDGDKLAATGATLTADADVHIEVHEAYRATPPPTGTGLTPTWAGRSSHYQHETHEHMKHTNACTPPINRTRTDCNNTKGTYTGGSLVMDDSSLAILPTPLP